MSEWTQDVLGRGFEARALELEPDAEGSVVATLIRAAPPRPRTGLSRLIGGRATLEKTDVLYVHGWSEYFYQAHVGQFWRDLGAQFYALDLRKYGRSIRPGQSLGYVDDLATYDEEIEAAIEAMGPRRGRKLVLMGHSTGGLTLSLWAARNPKRVDALVLNSPWLEYQLSSVARTAIKPAVDVSARLDPKRPMPTLDFGFYMRTVSKDLDGEWDVNHDWRPLHGFPVRPGWLNAVLTGHATVASGLGLDCPILVMLSTKSLLSPRWSREMTKADVAIDVDIVARRAINLGTNVTIRRIPDAIHDVFLSSRAVRQDAFDALRTWLRGNL